MPAAFLLLHAFLLALALAVPLLLARDKPRRAQALLGLGALFLPVQLAVTRWPWLLAMTGWADVVFVSELYAPLAVLVAVSGMLSQPPGPARRRTIVLGAGLVTAGILATTLPLRPPAPLTATGREKDGVVLQTYDSSCAAAAAATLLRALAIAPAATEADLARLCLTRPSGTSDLGLYRGLRLAAPDRAVRFAWPGLDGLRRLGRPCIVFAGLDPDRVQDPLRTVLREQCGWTEGVAHAVVLLELQDDAVTIGDPRNGRERWSMEHFVALWDGTALIVE